MSAMGLSQIALTAHVVLDGRGSGADAVLQYAEHELHEHFEIRHFTLQIESAAYARSCALRDGAGGS